MTLDVDDLLARVPEASWSVCVRDAATAEVLVAWRPDDVMRLASVGKLLLLEAVVREVDGGRLSMDELVPRTAEDSVADSGLWQHLAVDSLSVADLCVLVGSVSDNLATNVLLRRVGISAVRRVTGDLGLKRTELLDRVRDARGPGHPPTLSRGTTSELSWLFAGRLHARVVGWLATDTDLSMVAAAMGLDPLAHVERDRGLLLRHKTGTDTGLRVDVGVLDGPAAAVAYAVAVEFDDADRRRDDVLDVMHAIGTRLCDHIVPT